MAPITMPTMAPAVREWLSFWPLTEELLSPEPPLPEKSPLEELPPDESPPLLELPVGVDAEPWSSISSFG